MSIENRLYQLASDSNKFKVTVVCDYYLECVINFAEVGPKYLGRENQLKAKAYRSIEAKYKRQR